MDSQRCRLVWISDPHLLHARAAGTLPAFLAELEDACRGVDGLIATGDFAEARELEPHLVELSRAAGTKVYFVLGNHDYYGGYVEEVRERVVDLTRRHPNLIYLHRHGAVSLPGGVAVVGTDGWGDARLGNWSSSRVILNDFHLVYDLAALPGPEFLARLRALGDESALHLRRALEEALRSHNRVVVATHVPPFAEAAWHEGRQSDPDFLPFFACRATGEVLRQAARGHPQADILVLCGHTHGGGIVRPEPNLTVRTGGVEYGQPQIHGTFDLP